jgi:hypothetical protein
VEPYTVHQRDGRRFVARLLQTPRDEHVTFFTGMGVRSSDAFNKGYADVLAALEPLGYQCEVIYDQGGTVTARRDGIQLADYWRASATRAHWFAGVRIDPPATT